ncbi:MAG: FecR domain-containing protein [Opitutaceae bacterium]|nr:FecR domain-containing protein [Opitutaceae bacterium]
MQRKQPNFSADFAPADDPVARMAAIWLARRDRGLSTAEAEEFGQWEGADPRHAAEFARLKAAWQFFDRAKAIPELAELARRIEAGNHPSRSRRILLTWGGAMAAAAVVLLVAWIARRNPLPSDAVKPAVTADYQVVPNAARQLRLADGSVVELHGDSEVRADFTPVERRVRLLRGEAHFVVTKNPDRPFIVAVESMAVRAVGTAFNVNFGSAAIEVLVTEGKVQVEEAAGSRQEPSAVSLVVAGQRAIIAREAAGSPAKVAVDSLTPAEIEQTLAWKNTWFVFDRTPLEEAVEAFNRHSVQRIVVGDALLRGRRLGGRFRADNVEGFVRMVELSVGVRAEHRGENQIVLLPAAR